MMTLFSRIKGRQGRVAGTAQHAADVIPPRPNEPGVPACWRKIIARGAGDVVLTAVISTALTCLVLLVGGLLFGLAQTGSAADWLATVFNGIVAVTAVGAFIVARSWLPQLTTQEGYKLAIELVNDHYLGLVPQKSLLTNIRLVFEYICQRQDGENRPGTPVCHEDAIKVLEQSLQEQKSKQDTMEQIRRRLATYGLHEASPVRAHFEALDRTYRDMCQAAAMFGPILDKMNETLKVISDYKPNSGMMYLEPIDEKLLTYRGKAEQVYKMLETSYAQMQKAYDELFCSYPAIGDLFVVRRR